MLLSDKTSASNFTYSVAVLAAHTIRPFWNPIHGIRFFQLFLMLLSYLVTSRLRLVSVLSASGTGLNLFRRGRFHIRTCGRTMFQGRRGRLHSWRTKTKPVRGLQRCVRRSLLCEQLWLFRSSHFAVAVFRERKWNSSVPVRPCSHVEASVRHKCQRHQLQDTYTASSKQ